MLKRKTTDGRSLRFAAYKWQMANRIYDSLTQPLRVKDLMSLTGLSRASVLTHLGVLQAHGCITRERLQKQGQPTYLYSRVDDNPPRRNLFQIPLGAVDDPGIYLAPHYGPVEMADYIGKAYGLEARKAYEAAVLNPGSARISPMDRGDRSAEILQFLEDHPGSTVADVAQQFRLASKTAGDYLKNLRRAKKVTVQADPGKPFTYTVAKNANTKTATPHPGR